MSPAPVKLIMTEICAGLAFFLPFREEGKGREVCKVRHAPGSWGLYYREDVLVFLSESNMEDRCVEKEEKQKERPVKQVKM